MTATHNPMASTTIMVTCEYVQDPPEVYSVQLSGNPTTEEDITQQLLSLSLSSPTGNINSYTFNINQPKGEVVIRHNCPSLDRPMDISGAIQQLQKQVLVLEKKDEEREKKEEKDLEWEVLSRIAQAINDETISDWRLRGDRVGIVLALERRKIHFLPYTMTAEAIHWRTRFPNDNSVFPIERFYTKKEQDAYNAAAIRNQYAQKEIDRAWLFLEEDKINLELMLTSWAKCGRGQGRVCMVPSAAFAERYITANVDFHGKVGERAIEYIQDAQDFRGEKLFY